MWQFFVLWTLVNLFVKGDYGVITEQERKKDFETKGDAIAFCELAKLKMKGDSIRLERLALKKNPKLKDSLLIYPIICNIRFDSIKYIKNTKGDEDYLPQPILNADK